jgi:hypothetical protein
MTQDEIIEMYLQVSKELCNDTEWCWAGVGEPLQMFAKLVAAKEEKKWQDQTAVEIHEAVLEEREACAKVAEHSFGVIGSTIALAIRARTGEQT